MAHPISPKLSAHGAAPTRSAALSRLRRALGWMLALLLAASLPIHSVTSAVADLLGPRHAHRATASVADRADPMTGWRDFRRAHYDHLNEASIDAETAHALAHATGERHHHGPFDTTVENLEMTSDDAGAAAGTASATAVVVFIAAVAPMPLAAPGQAMGSGWQTPRDERFRSAETRRLERPPQRPG